VVVITMGDTRIVVVMLDCTQRRGQAQLGFKAPPEVRIHRAEIQTRVDREDANG
jgi:sRNA-binding carbon storage regulator CsrA